MQKIPEGAVGVVTFGSSALPLPRGAETLVAAFNSSGAEVGRISGDAISSAATVTWNQGLTTANADSLITLTDAGRTDVAIDENMLEGAASYPSGDGALLWFNTGRPDGQAVPYRQNLAITGDAASPALHSISGLILTAGYCGSKSYGVAVTFDDLTSGEKNVQNVLYEMTAEADPVMRGDWEDPADFRPFSRTSVCSPDGNYLFNIFGTETAIRDKTGNSSLFLARIDTLTGDRELVAIDMTGHHGVSEPNTLSLVDDRLYWVGADGSVLSLSVSDPSGGVRVEWKIPQWEDAYRVTVSNGAVVSVMGIEGIPSYAELDIRTGEAIRGPIAIPWVAEELNKNKESVIMDVDRLSNP